MNKQKDVYCNQKQLNFLDAKQKIKFALCGRGFGKSHLIGDQIIDLVKGLPGAKITIIGMSYAHIKTKTLPAVKQCWRGYGLWEWDKGEGKGEFCSFVKPPRSWIKNMIAPPDSWDYVISFPNGTHIQLVSWATIETARGSSFDACLIDEAGLLPEDYFNEVISQTIRGNIYKFKNHLHHNICFFTSIPWTPLGQWVFKYEELAKENPKKYFWIEGSAEDNKDVLGEEWIEDQRERLPEMKFRVEVMNERISKLPDGFYHAFDDKTHTVSYKEIILAQKSCGFPSEKIEEIQSLTLAHEHEALWEMVKDSPTNMYVLNTEKALDITFDFNAALNSIIVGQERKEHNLYVFFQEYFVKYQSYMELVKWFCKTYKTYPTKVVNVYGDRNGNKRSADNAPTFFETIIKELRNNGWHTNHHSTGGVEQLHQARFDVINDLYAHKYKHLPTIKYLQEGCKYTIISIQNTPVMDNFKKDKSSERKMKDRREEATDLGDASDYLLFDKYAKRVGVLSSTSHIPLVRS